MAKSSDAISHYVIGQHGAVAKLGSRFNSFEKVEGSSPSGSTRGQVRKGTIIKNDATEGSMREKIRARLKDIEIEKEIRVLYACESGSRAWGFPSVDSQCQ